MADALFERELDRALRDDLAHDTRTTFVPATDGFPLGATVVRARDRAKGAVVLAPATGVRRRYYAAFQRWLAGQGFDVVTFDYRGIGDSRPPSLAGFHARMHHWGERDLAGVIAFVERELAPSSLLLVGHSVGGQLVGLAENADRLDGILCVGSQSGDFRLWPAPARYRLALYWYAFLPTLTATWGYLPSGVMGEELPRGVLLEWAKWCRTDGYLLGGEGAARRARYARVRAPLLAYGFDDDTYAPPAAVAGLLDLYPNAARDRRQVSPRAEGLGEVGHFGFFRERFRDSLWLEARDWLSARAEGRPPVAARVSQAS